MFWWISYINTDGSVVRPLLWDQQAMNHCLQSLIKSYQCLTSWHSGSYPVRHLVLRSYWVSTKTGWPCVSIMSLHEIASWICYFYLRVTGYKNVTVDPFPGVQADRHAHTWNHFTSSVKQGLKTEQNYSGREIKDSTHSKNVSMPEDIQTKHISGRNWKVSVQDIK